MRRVIAPIAAAVLALAIAGPVAADPTVQQSHWTDAVYHITCADGTVIPDQFAHGVPGWDVEWQPGGTPWILLGYTINRSNGTTYVRPLPPGLDGAVKLFGPCTATADGWTGSITDAWFLRM